MTTGETSIRWTRPQGAAFTLIELIFSISVMSVLLLALVVPAGFFLGKAETEWTVQSGLASVEQCLAEMEGAIRASDEVSKAGPGILEITTRYVFDRDDGAEVVRYSLAGDRLLREIVSGGSGNEKIATLLTGVESFSANACGVHDEFLRTDYAVSLPLGDALAFVSDVDTVFKVVDFGVVDADLKAAYNVNLERLDLRAAASYVSATVTPPLQRDGIQAKVNFYPHADGNEYRPLVYGDETPNTNNVAVIFSSDQRILLRKSEGGVPVDAMSAFTWSASNSYTVGLLFKGGTWMAWTDSGNGIQWIGSVAAGEIDNKKLYLQVNTSGAEGGFDSLSVDYPQVDLELRVEMGGSARQFVGGASRRSM